MSKIKGFLNKTQPLIWALVFIVSGISTARAAVDPKAGYELFKNNCKRCHYATDQKFTGPGLQGVRARWGGDEAKIIAWVKSSSSFLKTGDAYANKLYNDYDQSAMPDFPQLKDEDIQSILAYLDDPSVAGDEKAAAPAGPVDEGGAPQKKDYTGLILILAAALLVLIILGRALKGVTRAMENMKREKAGEPLLPEDRPFDFFRNLRDWMMGHKKLTLFIGLVLVSVVFLQAFWALNEIGVYKDYKPKQPIAFSHKVHAGQNGIQCQYCHTGVEKSRHASIPSVNVCMNCHKAVQEGPKTGKTEITKIYASIGWNPVDLKYWEDYENVPAADVQKVFAEYMGEDRVAYEGVKDFIQKEVEWVQVYNLPEHAYFNHSQHYKVGKVECETCHGKVAEMDEIFQFTKLTMGWCINCHRETKVQYADNKYYERLHNYYKEHYGEYEMLKGEAFTVEKIGGLECSKCHY